jgi:hypothetical protein
MTKDQQLAGYGHADYAHSLAGFGTPRPLLKSGGWILVRRIAGTPYQDAMGCYPLFVCRDWSRLDADLEEIGDKIVSLAVVTDPFSEFDAAHLARCFPDVSIPFKEHYVTDLSCDPDAIVSKHHLYYARKALQRVGVEVVASPGDLVDEWVRLYSVLTARHALRGIKAFSRDSFGKQLAVPGTLMFRALCQGRMVGGHIWYLNGDVAYSHLAACDDAGYDAMASYALHWTALKHLASRVKWLDLGAGAGLEENGGDGLTAFKRGWSTGSKTVYFAGRVFDRAAYATLVAAAGARESGYFPAYRGGAF